MVIAGVSVTTPGWMIVWKPARRWRSRTACHTDSSSYGSSGCGHWHGPCSGLTVRFPSHTTEGPLVLPVPIPLYNKIHAKAVDRRKNAIVEADLRDHYGLADEPVAVWVADQFYDPTGDHDDVLQEARFGLVRAISDYQPGASAFRSFAFLCCKRQVITALKRATLGRHAILTAASRSAIDEHGEQFDAADALPDIGADTVEILARSALLDTIVRVIRDELSPCERKWLVDVVFCGRHYAKNKTADNALQRARRKLAAALEKAA